MTDLLKNFTIYRNEVAANKRRKCRANKGRTLVYRRKNSESGYGGSRIGHLGYIAHHMGLIRIFWG